MIRDILDYQLFHIGDYMVTVSLIIKIIVYLLVARFFLWLVKKTLLRQGQFRNLDSGSRHALLQIVSYVVWVVVIVLGLESIGVKVTILIASSAALLVGIGLGLQQTFNDIFSGIILLFEGSIKVDDVLEVGDDVVKVRRIGLRASIVENRNQIIMIMPNSRIVTDTVINWSHTKKQSRFMINIGVAYGTDVELVCAILIESAKSHPSCSLDREPLSRLVNFGDSSLDFELYFWTEKMFEVEQTKSDIRKIIVSKFKEHEVVIPFPQRDLHFKSNSTSTTPKD